jgi:DNA-binding CsgD family transcriptional regulator
MDLRSLAIFLLDNTGKISFSNPAAAELLEFTPSLRSAGGEWLGPFPSDGGMIEFEPDERAGKYRVSRTRLTNGRPEVTYVCLLLAQVGHPRQRRRQRLLETWKLTAAELRLAEAMLDGKRPAAAAESLGVTIHTVRTYLKRLYRKLGVHSQATLVCALSKSLE